MRRNMRAIIRETVLRHGILWLALLLAAAVKAALLAQQAFPFNADEAVVALMARHMLQGEAPLLFYGQAYMGSLDSALGAAGFSIFGQSVVVIRIIQSLLYLGTIVIWYRLCWKGFDSLVLARLVAILLSVPSVLVTLYTTVSLGGYGEALFLGSLCLLLAVEIRKGAAHPSRRILLGLAAGIGFWSFPLSLVFSLPAVCATIISRPGVQRPHSDRPFRIGILLTLTGCFVGALPWIVAALRLGAPALQELGGSAIAGTVQGDFLEAVGVRLLNLFLFGTTVVLGLRPPWSVDWLVPWLLPIALLLGLASIAHGLISLRRSDDASFFRRLLGVSALLLCMAYVLTPFGNDPSGRYFLPLSMVLAVCTAGFIRRISGRFGRVAYGLLLIPLLFHALGTVECARRNPPGITTQFDQVAQIDMRNMQPLMDFLQSSGETRGYSNYWVSYPLAFLSREQLIFTPRLPYHADLRYTPRDNRYAPYDLVVAQSARIAYITTRNPALDALLQRELAARGITYQIHRVGDFTVYYDLSARIEPEALGFPKSDR